MYMCTHMSVTHRENDSCLFSPAVGSYFTTTAELLLKTPEMGAGKKYIHNCAWLMDCCRPNNQQSVHGNSKKTNHHLLTKYAINPVFSPSIFCLIFLFHRNLSFRVTPKDTLTCGHEEQGIKPSILRLMDDSLYLLSHSCSVLFKLLAK